MNVIVTIRNVTLQIDVQASSQPEAENQAPALIDIMNDTLRDCYPEAQPAIIWQGDTAITSEVRV